MSLIRGRPAVRALLSISGSAQQARYLDLADPVVLAKSAAVLLAVLGTLFAVGLQAGRQVGGSHGGGTGYFRNALAQQRGEIAGLRRLAQERADALAGRLAALNAHLARIDVLGRHLTPAADAGRREFNFDEGPVPPAAAGGQGAVDIAAAVSSLEHRVDSRDAQLVALENLLNQRRIAEATRPVGAPVAPVIITSYFGWRRDPVNGEGGRFHEGLDFAGAPGAPVQAVADGVVTRAGEDGGYGNLVEISHGNGYVTRYAHNRQILVKVGQSVVRGQPVALMGSTGHSTGPHVHFEVRYAGHAVDPLPYVKAGRAKQS